MGNLSNLKSPPKQTPCKILKGVLFKILQSSLFIRHYATNLALIQEKLEVSTKIYDVSKDANQNLQSLEQIRQNVDDEITDSQKAKKKLDQTKKLLDTLGVGKSLEKGVNKLDDHLQEATGLKGEVISAMQDLEKVYRQLDQI